MKSKEEIIQNLQTSQKAPFKVTFEIFESNDRKFIADYSQMSNYSTQLFADDTSSPQNAKAIKEEILDISRKKNQERAIKLLKNLQADTQNYNEIKTYFTKKISELGLQDPLIHFDDMALRIDIGYGLLEFQILFKDFLMVGGVYQKNILREQKPRLFGKAPETIFKESCINEEYKNTLDKEEQRLKQLAFNSVPYYVNAIGAAANVDEQTLIKQCLEGQKGLVVGEVHSDKSPKQFLIDNMSFFRSQGVKVLYLEHLLFESHQQLLDSYFNSAENAPMPKRLELYLKSMDAERKLTGSATYLELVKTAKKNGIRIVAFDSEATYRLGMCNNSGDLVNQVELIKVRCKVMNTAMVESFNKNYKKDEKFVVFVGSAHAVTYEGVQGVSELLGCPNMIIHDYNKNKKQEKIEKQSLFSDDDGHKFQYDILYHRNPAAKISSTANKEEEPQKETSELVKLESDINSLKLGVTVKVIDGDKELHIKGGVSVVLGGLSRALTGLKIKNESKTNNLGLITVTIKKEDLPSKVAANFGTSLKEEYEKKGLPVAKGYLASEYLQYSILFLQIKDTTVHYDESKDRIYIQTKSQLWMQSLKGLGIIMQSEGSSVSIDCEKYLSIILGDNFNGTLNKHYLKLKKQHDDNSILEILPKEQLKTQVGTNKRDFAMECLQSDIKNLKIDAKIDYVVDKNSFCVRSQYDWTELNLLMQSLKNLGFNVHSSVENEVAVLHIDCANAGIILELGFYKKLKDVYDRLAAEEQIYTPEKQPGKDKKVRVDILAQQQAKEELNQDVCHQNTPAQNKLSNKPRAASQGFFQTVPVVKPLAELFHSKHESLYKSERGQGCFGWLRKTNVKSDWDLNQIIQHARSSNNRSRRVCVALNWMNKDGTLNIKAPPEVEDAYKASIEPKTNIFKW